MRPIEACQNLYEKDILPILERDLNGNHWKLAIKYILFRCDCVSFEKRLPGNFNKWYNRKLQGQFSEIKGIIKEIKANENQDSAQP